MMGNYEQLKTAVASIIRDNGEEEITGNVLQSVLISIINSVGSGAVFAGIATPSTSPSNPDPNMFYIAVEAGTYPNFNLTVTTGMCIFSNESGTWVGHELGVSSQFESGEYITEVSITDTLEGAETDNLPTVGAVNEAVTAFNTAIATERQDRQEADGNQTVALNLEKTLRQQGDDANAASVGYYVCDTAAATAAKAVNASGYVLRIGGNIHIEMTNANTADNATLNINSTGAKALYYGSTRASSTNSWSAGDVLTVYYDGTQYRAEAMKVVNDLTTGGGNVALSAQQGVVLRKMIDGGNDDVALTVSWTSGKYYSYKSNTNKLGASDAGAAFNIASIDVHEYIGRSLTIHCMSSNANTYSGFVGSDGTTAVEHWQDTTTADITKTVPAGAYYLLLTNSTSEMASPSVTLLGESLDERITKLEQGTDASKVTYGGTNVEDALDDLNEEVTDNLQSTANRVAYIEVTPSKNGTANNFWQYNSYQNKVTQSKANNFIAIAAHINAGEMLKFILPPNGTSAASSSYVMSDDGVLLETITNNTVAAGDTRIYNKDATAYLNYYNKSSNEVLATVSEECYSNLILTRKVDELTATSPSAELEGITVYCVGDSITAGKTLSDPTHMRWNAQLAEMYGWNLTVNATGGVPLSTNGDPTNAIAKKIDALASVTDIPDLIIIWGGHNDVWYQPAPLGDFGNLAEEDTSGVLPTYANKNTFCGALRYCAEVAHHYCPDAKVYFLTLEMCGTITPDLAMSLSAGKTVADMNNAIMEAGRRYQCGTIDMGLCGINCVNGVANGMTSDGIHPNLLGTKQIVAYLSKYLSNSFIKTRE